MLLIIMALLHLNHEEFLKELVFDQEVLALSLLMVMIILSILFQVFP